MKKILLSALVLVTAQTVFSATTVEWWQFWTDAAIKPVIEEIVADFEKQNPDIDVKITDLTWANGHEKIAIAFASKTAPDIVELGSDWIAQFAVNGQLADITEEIAGDSSEFHGWGMATWNDQVYAAPWILGTRVLYGNRDLLTRAGYPPNFLPVTWAELKEASIKIRALDKNIYGWGSNTAEKHRLYKKFLPFFWSNGSQFFTDDGLFCLLPSTKSIEALRLYKELHDSAGYVADQRGIEDAFLDGKVGFVFSGDWMLKRIELENRPINFFTTLVPGPKFPGRSFMGGEFLAVSEQSENKDEAIKFIKFLTAPEQQVKFCKANRSANPSSRAAQKDNYFTGNQHLQTFIRQILSSNYPPVDPDWVVMEDIIERAVEDALFGSGNSAQALLDAKRKIEQLKARK
jgi:multiple sugar transport system substrate-binding protein